MLNRSDIRSDPGDGSVEEGIPFELLFHVNRIDGDGCLPFEGAVVDIWHCDAAGVYSDVNDPRVSTIGQKFLRGYQETGADGSAAFTTIFPGWYRGRTVHIHFKIRTASASGEAYEFTSQLYFDDSVTDEIFKQAPYAGNGERTVRNADDNVYRNGGDQLLITPVQTTQGYSAAFDIGLQLS
jgi:protocatechuate 3,4-dioxygenase beta subunit